MILDGKKEAALLRAEIKKEILEIKNIVEKNKASFAFPSTSIYVEKNS